MAKRTIANLNIQLSAGSATLRQDLQQATGHVNGFAGSITGVATKIAGAFAGVFAVSKITSAISSTMESIDSLAKTSDRLGITTEALQGVQMAAELAGVGMTELESGGRKMMKQISEAASGTESAAQAFTELGLSASQLQNMSFGDQMAAITDALRGVGNETDRTRLAMEIFGRSGTAFLALDGSQIRAAAADVEALGTGITRLEAAKVEEANDAITRMKAALGNLVTEAAIAVAPALTAAAESVTLLAAWLNNLDPVTVGNTVKLVGFVAGIAAVVAILPRINSAIRTVIVTLRALGSAQAIATALSGPAGWLKLAASAGVAAAGIATISAAFDAVEASAARAATASASSISASGSGTLTTQQYATEMAAWKKAADEFDKIKFEIPAAEFEARRNALAEQRKRLEAMSPYFVEDIGAEEAKIAAEQAEAARQKALKQMEDFQRRANEITSGVESPMEKYQRQMEELKALFDQRLITPETQERAGRKYKEELESALQVQERIADAQRAPAQSATAMEKGTTQAFSAIQNGAKEWRELVRSQKAMEKAQQQANKSLAAIEANTKTEPIKITEAKL